MGKNAFRSFPNPPKLSQRTPSPLSPYKLTPFKWFFQLYELLLSEDIMALGALLFHNSRKPQKGTGVTLYCNPPGGTFGGHYDRNQ